VGLEPTTYGSVLTAPSSCQESQTNPTHVPFKVDRTMASGSTVTAGLTGPRRAGSHGEWESATTG
jgi:hypothetical protein